jgi:hypothetical protein
MERKDFLKSACTLGICSCACVSILSGTALASVEEKKEQDWRIGFMQKRFAKLLEGINTSVPQETKMKILEDVGHTCALEYAESFTKFKGNPDAYLEELKKDFAENVTHDKNSKTIKIIGKKQDKCGCPFVNKSITPKDFCSCSIGYFKESMSTVLGQPVDVKIEESVLRGGERCNFTITVK